MWFDDDGPKICLHFWIEIRSFQPLFGITAEDGQLTMTSRVERRSNQWYLSVKDEALGRMFTFYQYAEI